MPEFLRHAVQHVSVLRLSQRFWQKVFCDMLPGRKLNSCTRLVEAFCLRLLCTAEYAALRLVKALRYKAEIRGFDSW